MFIQDEPHSTVSADLRLQVSYPGRKIGLSQVFLSSPVYENITKLSKTRRKVPSSRKDLPTSGDTRHEACCSFVAKCFHGLRLNLGVSTKPESTQMRMSNAYI